MATSQVSVPTATPPQWANALMRIALKTPGLQRLLGRSLMLLSFTGRRSGDRYTIPVSYARLGDHVLVVTKLFRHWWKNFAEHPEVEVRLAGRRYSGMACAARGSESRYEELLRYLEDRPMDAKAYGVRRVDGAVSGEDIRKLLPQIVLVDIELKTASSRT